MESGHEIWNLENQEKITHEKVHNLYSSPDITKVIKSRWMTWIGQQKYWKPHGKRPLKRLGQT